MAVTYQQSVAFAQANTVSVSFTLGTAPLEGDVIVLFVNCNASKIVRDVTGWTNVLGSTVANQGSTVHSISAMTHVVTAGEAGASQVTWTLDPYFFNNSQHSGIAVVYRGADTTTPADDFDTTSSSTATTNASIPVLTPTVTGGKVLAFVTNDSGVADPTTPSGWTLRATNNSAEPASDVFEWNTETTSGVNTSAATVTGANDEKAVIAFVLAAAGAPPPPSTVYEGWGIAT